jgi:hypothetical protein
LNTSARAAPIWREHGKPVALYSDKHGIFRVNSKDAAGGDGVTQFGRALLALNIDIICADSPQAKGRIERAFGSCRTGWSRACPRERGGAAAGGGILDCRGERMAAWVHRRLSRAKRPGAMFNTEPPPGSTAKPFASIFISLPVFVAIVPAFGSRRNTSRRLRDATERGHPSTGRPAEVGRHNPPWRSDAEW